jgi:glutamate 5-kinase
MKIRNNRLVVKIGTANLINGGEVLSRPVVADVAAQIAELWNEGIETVLVTSGAIAAGRAHCFSSGHNPDLFAKSRLASIGAWPILSLWGEAFLKHNLLIGQGWITFASWRTPAEQRNLIQGIYEMLSLRVVPVINENDFLADEEARALERGISDNDWLASKVALLIKAGAILFLSDTPGLYEADPKTVKAARQYREIDARKIPAHFREGKAGVVGRGGVRSKVFAAAACAKNGIYAVVDSFRIGEDTILQFARGESSGTIIGTQTIFH